MNDIIIRNSIKFATSNETVFICSLLINDKPQMIAPINIVVPPIYARITGSCKRIFCFMDTAIIPARVEKNVASKIGKKISAGFTAPD